MPKLPTPKDKEIWNRMFKQGWPIKDIAKQTKFSADTVSKHLRKMGVKGEKRAKGVGGEIDYQPETPVIKPEEPEEPTPEPWPPAVVNLKLALFDYLNVGAIHHQTAIWIENACRCQPAHLSDPYTFYWFLAQAGIDPNVAWQIARRVFTPPI